MPIWAHFGHILCIFEHFWTFFEQFWTLLKKILCFATLLPAVIWTSELYHLHRFRHKNKTTTTTKKKKKMKIVHSAAVIVVVFSAGVFPFVSNTRCQSYDHKIWINEFCVLKNSRFLREKWADTKVWNPALSMFLSLLLNTYLQRE